MRMRARQVIGLVVLLVVPAITLAQVVWQPAQPPLVTADNEPWFLRADPIIWAGAYYYPTGPRVFFNGNEMVRSGSFRGIPLYTDATHDAISVVYMPVNGGLMQPYERRRTGELAGTTGNMAPSFPTDVGRQGMPPEGIAVDIAQNPGPPDFAPPYDVAPLIGERPVAPAAPPEVVEQAGRSIVYAPRAGARPRGLNAIWVEYDGRRWFASGTAETLDANRFSERGSYHGFPVYTRKGERDTIYIPSVPGLLTPYKLRK